MPALTERDLAVLLDVYKYRYLTVSQIARLHFPSRQTAYRRLRCLTGLKLLTGFTAPTLTEQMYFLSKAGAAAVAGSLGLPVDDLPWPETFRAPKDYYFLCHFVQVTDFRITLTASCESSAIKLLGFIPEYLVSKTTTGSLLKHIKDYVCDVSRPTEQLNHTPDAVFALERDGVPALFFLEIDRGTEVVGNPEKGVLKACRFYMSYLLSSAFQRYGQDFACAPFRGFRALFVTTSESRLQNIRQAVSALDPACKAKKFIWLALFSEVAENITDIPWRSADAADTATYRIA